jgi:PAS domain S-box-containing protein
MIADDQVMGVIEMASLRSLEQHEIEFVEKLAEDIGSTLISTRVNERTNKLLEESKVRSEEMAAQEEELRQNLEELQATQDEMKRIKTEEEKKEEDRRRAEEEMMLKLKEQNRKLKEDESVLKAQQDELEKEKVLMDTLMENVPDYIYFKDKDCKFVRISRSMVRLFPGADNPEDLIGKSDFDFHKPEAAQQFYDDEKSIMNTGEAIIDDIVHEEFDDGQDQWVSTTKMPLKNKEGKTIGIWGLTKNITNIKNLEIEARQQAEASKVHEEEVNKYRQMLSDILENIPGKVFVKDEEGNILLSNSAVANLYDCTVEELIGKSDYDFYPKETADKFRAEELNIMREGKQSWLQAEEQKGVTARLYTTKMPFYIKTREETGLLGIQIDITDIVNQGEGISDELLKEKGEEVQKYIDRIEEARKEIEKLKKRRNKK